jgi:hypothetical protein
METIHQEAMRLGVQQPVLQHYEYQEGQTTVIALTPESDRAWSEYLHNVTMARLVLKYSDQ